ncbi:hypothetical protein HG536_0B01170 [Torulaspora globosa]|uniref:Retrograde transport protein Dsl1 C-terminal domain-containing protein n=1 Tax=Torulaspora globosa TaxID=48254 RepID=A0A7G3ZCM0_9SACH|nr:uncharacterized protein HG536_0B01170 [Torulaspora globosa]QLL31256.1 hypothetical protein HG536_0B01170 [Torulaspora globosa]
MNVGLTSVGDEIGSILGNRDEIARQLGNDPLFRNNEHGESSDIGTEAILRREKELSSELHDFTALKTVPGLILEFKTNLRLLELENCFYSLQALRRKLHANFAIINRSFGLQRSVATYVDNMHLDLVNTLFATLKDGFWKISADAIDFQSTVAHGEDQVQVQYADLMESVENLYFPSGQLDPKLWIISDMVLGTLQETLRDKLNTILNEHVKLSGIIIAIKSSLFAENKQFVLTNNNSKLLFENSMKIGDEKVEETANSFKSLLLFMRETVVLRDRKILAQKLGSLIATELAEFIKANSSVVFRPENAQLRFIIEGVNEDLVKLSTETNSWSYDGAAINDLFNNDQIPRNLQIDKVFHDQVTELRVFFADKAWQRLEVVASAAAPLSPAQSPARRKRLPSSSKRSINSDWGWEEKTGWDEHMDLDLGEKHSASEVASTESRKDTASDAADDAWDEAWNIEIEDDESEKQKSADNDLDDSEVRVTQLPAKITALVRDFDEGCHGSGQEIDESYYKHKLNVLQTTIMAIASRQYRNNWWQLHIDLKQIIQLNPCLTRLQELTVNNLDLYLNTSESVVYKLVCQQLNELKQNERYCSWNVTVDQLLPFVKTKILEPLVMIGNNDSQRPLCSFLRFLYEECVIKNILQWQIISERSSENLSEFVSLLYSGTEISALNGNKSYRECREKFAIIGKFLPLHLKDIMEMFYNGDFYLFTTDELVRWIVLLFAETPLRRNAIDDIYEIRNADVGED